MAYPLYQMTTEFTLTKGTAMNGTSDITKSADFTEILDKIEYPDAFRITYLANAIVFPAYALIKRDFGLARAEYILLACLSHYDVLTAQIIANISRHPRNTISRAVHRMREIGYLKRAPDPVDGRQSTLEITDTGRAVHEQIATYLKARQEQVLGGLSAGDRTALEGILRKAALYAATLNE